jgi:hypothetical protein
LEKELFECLNLEAEKIQCLDRQSRLTKDDASLKPATIASAERKDAMATDRAASASDDEGNPNANFPKPLPGC